MFSILWTLPHCPPKKWSGWCLRAVFEITSLPPSCLLWPSTHDAASEIVLTGRCDHATFPFTTSPVPSRLVNYVSTADQAREDSPWKDAYLLLQSHLLPACFCTCFFFCLVYPVPVSYPSLFTELTLTLSRPSMITSSFSAYAIIRGT